MRLPDFIIIGAAKSGTTSLHHYLLEHPRVSMSDPKELNFFVDAPVVGNWHRGLAWYKSFFPAGKLNGESSPAYTFEGENYAPKAALRIKNIMPDAKLIYLLRNPIERIQSHYLQMLFMGRIPLKVSLDDLLSRGPGCQSGIHGDCYTNIVYSSLYCRQISHYLNFFSLEQIHFLTLEDLKRDPAAEMFKLWKFLGIEEDAPSQVSRTIHNNTSHKKIRIINPTARMKKIVPRYDFFSSLCPAAIKYIYRKSVERPLETRERKFISEKNLNRLFSLLSPDIEKLSRITGREYSAWQRS